VTAIVTPPAAASMGSDAKSAGSEALDRTIWSIPTSGAHLRWHSPSWSWKCTGATYEKKLRPRPPSGFAYFFWVKKQRKSFYYAIAAKTSRVAFAVLDIIEDSFIRSKRPQGMLTSEPL
jgi:hypothetical protein